MEPWFTSKTFTTLLSNTMCRNSGALCGFSQRISAIVFSFCGSGCPRICTDCSTMLSGIARDHRLHLALFAHRLRHLRVRRAEKTRRIRRCPPGSHASCPPPPAGPDQYASCGDHHHGARMPPGAFSLMNSAACRSRRWSFSCAASVLVVRSEEPVVPFPRHRPQA